MIAILNREENLSHEKVQLIFCKFYRPLQDENIFQGRMLATEAKLRTLAQSWTHVSIAITITSGNSTESVVSENQVVIKRQNCLGSLERAKTFSTFPHQPFL